MATGLCEVTCYCIACFCISRMITPSASSMRRPDWPFWAFQSERFVDRFHLLTSHMAAHLEHVCVLISVSCWEVKPALGEAYWGKMRQQFLFSTSSPQRESACHLESARPCWNCLGFFFSLHFCAKRSSLHNVQMECAVLEMLWQNNETKSHYV